MALGAQRSRVMNGLEECGPAGADRSLAGTTRRMGSVTPGAIDAVDRYLSSF